MNEVTIGNFHWAQNNMGQNSWLRAKNFTNRNQTVGNTHQCTKLNGGIPPIWSTGGWKNPLKESKWIPAAAVGCLSYLGLAYFIWVVWLSYEELLCNFLSSYDTDFKIFIRFLLWVCLQKKPYGTKLMVSTYGKSCKKTPLDGASGALGLCPVCNFRNYYNSE